MSLNIIPAKPSSKRTAPSGTVLRISEFFCDSIQGEGVHLGAPAAFLRLQGCTLNCVYCDTKEVWTAGNPYSIEEIFQLMERPHIDLIRKLEDGQHLVITGGSPLLQQTALIAFIQAFRSKYKFIPFIELENECMIEPKFPLSTYVDCWNNSPKLRSSGTPSSDNFLVLKTLVSFYQSWFKFVITCREDWEEINTVYIETGLINRSQIILMPEGATIKKLERNRGLAVSLAIENNVRYSPREHVILWNDTIGV